MGCTMNHCTDTGISLAMFSPKFISDDWCCVFECKECSYRVEPDFPLADGECPACLEDEIIKPANIAPTKESNHE